MSAHVNLAHALSPDDYGRTVVHALSLPDDLDLDDEAAVALALIEQRMEWREANALLPHIVGKARELRRAFGLDTVGEALGFAGFVVFVLSGMFVIGVSDAFAAGVGAASGERGGDPAFVALLFSSALCAAFAVIQIEGRRRG